MHTRNAIEPGLYRHFKGARYRVLMTAQDSTNPPDGEATEEPVVIYVSLERGNVCARRLAQFTEPVLWPDGVTRPRFSRET